MYSNYFQATTNRPKTWFVIGLLKSEDNLSFTRTIDKQKSILEFFVTQENTEKFLSIMNTLKTHGYILHFEQKTNRLKN